MGNDLTVGVTVMPFIGECKIRTYVSACMLQNFSDFAH